MSGCDFVRIFDISQSVHHAACLRKRSCCERSNGPHKGQSWCGFHSLTASGTVTGHSNRSWCQFSSFPPSAPSDTDTKYQILTVYFVCFFSLLIRFPRDIQTHLAAK